MALPSARYEPRRSAEDVLFQIVQAHFETFRARAASLRDGEGLPRFVEQEFRDFLRCGWLAGGFARFRCPSCGFDRLVAFSCKGRGSCPGCGGRRMAERAAQLVDHVFPDVPARQWVLSLPAHPLTALNVAEVLATVEPRIARLLCRHGFGDGGAGDVDPWAEEAPAGGLGRGVGAGHRGAGAAAGRAHPSAGCPAGRDRIPPPAGEIVGGSRTVRIARGPTPARTTGKTSSTRCAARSAIRRPPQPGQTTLAPPTLPERICFPRPAISVARWTWT